MGPLSMYLDDRFLNSAEMNIEKTEAQNVTVMQQTSAHLPQRDPSYHIRRVYRQKQLGFRGSQEAVAKEAG